MIETLGLPLSQLLLILSMIPLILSLPAFGYLGLLASAAIYQKIKGSQHAPERAPSIVTSQRIHFVFIIPAHNEESGIFETVKSCFCVDYPAEFFSVYVIADNCSDKTPEKATEAGATVLERYDADRKSKGYALEWFFQKKIFETNSTQGASHAEKKIAFVIVDADSIVDRNILSCFEQDIHIGKQWIQCRYDVRNPHASNQTQLLTYALSLFNGVWLWGQDALGLGCALRGNGMCFTKEALTRFPWKAYGLTEDLEFSWLLRLSDEYVSFNEKTSVYGEMVSQKGKAAEGQRKRWEKGRKDLKSLFKNQIRNCQTLSPFKKTMCLIDISMPPLARLVPMIAFGIFLIASSIFLRLLAFSELPENQVTISAIQETSIQYLMILAIALVLLELSLLAAYLLSPFLLFRLPLSYLSTLFQVPGYLAWKTLILIKSKLQNKNTSPDNWVRTEREKK